MRRATRRRPRTDRAGGRALDTTRAPLRRFVTLALLAVTFACTTTADAPLTPEASAASESGYTEPIAGPSQPTKAPALEPPREQEEDTTIVQGLLDSASRHHIRQEYEAALRIVRDALSMSPPEPYGHRLRALELRVKSKLLTETYVDAFVQFRQERYVIGDVIEGEIILMNISTEDVVVPATKLVEQLGATEPVLSKSVFQSAVTYREYRPSNTLVINRDSKNFRVDEDIVLGRGEAFRIPIALDSMETNPSGTMLRSYTFDCKLFAAEIRVGDEVFFDQLVFRPGVARVYPRNAEHLQEAPLGSVKKSVERQAPVHLTLAASLVGPGQESELLGFLGRELDDPNCSETMQAAIMTSLLIVSGETDTRDKEGWLSWLRTRPKR